MSVSPDVRADFESALRAAGARSQYESGIALLVQVTEAAPESDRGAHRPRASPTSRRTISRSAEASLKRALELSPRHPVAHNELGIVYRKTGRFEEARKSYEKALELHPDFHFARRNLAILCDVYLADPACALENYELYAARGSGRRGASIWIADLRKRIGK